MVNLDAMIRREDFLLKSEEAPPTYEALQTISLRDLASSGQLVPLLRKPDFQRETNQWRPEQVVSLLECFISGDLIPSVILWRSTSFLFVIDGGHRLSVLRAWVEDDYGDGPLSKAFFGDGITKEQRKAASQTRKLVSERVGTWQHYQTQNNTLGLTEAERRKITTVMIRGLPIQWVSGDAEKAESSFFKINTKGTALDDVEQLILENRHRPIPIAARAIVRAGMGHKYWGNFKPDIQKQIELKASYIHQALFEPEVEGTVKNLDLPLGGSKGVRTALQVLMEFVHLAVRDQVGNPKRVKDQEEDSFGEETIQTLTKTSALVKRLTGNDNGSLGLHPAIYFYGPTGRHNSSLFMGTAALFARKLANNDSAFFKSFSSVRERVERILIEHKDLIATILQRTISQRRTSQYDQLLDNLVAKFTKNEDVQEGDLISLSGLSGKLVVSREVTKGSSFSDDAKSAAFLKSALERAIKCPICGGYIDTAKSVSYDHITRVSEGGTGDQDNCSLTHPYCNQSIKN